MCVKFCQEHNEAELLAAGELYRNPKPFGRRAYVTQKAKTNIRRILRVNGQE